ncbi:MAG: cation diffusion facilitator family transporter [Anaerocolumna sp.]
MTQFLVRIFIKDYKNYNNPKVRTAYGLLAGTVGIVCNIILFIVKLLIGYFINSISVMADAFNNLSDAASSVIGVVGVKIAQKPADKEHPFGHGRSEYIAAFVVAFLILQVGITCFNHSFKKILNPQIVDFYLPAIIILILSILVKLWLSVFNKRLGKLTTSEVMKATAADALGDVLITSVTVISIIIGRLTGIPIDGWMGIVVSIFVLLAGFNIAKETLVPLIGPAISRETYELITKKVESYDFIIGSHDLIVHNYGPSHTMATIHVEVPRTISLEDAHEIIDRIERDILREMDIFIVIHSDPVETEDAYVLKKRQEVIEIIQSIEPSISMHDFRILEDEGKNKLIFDILIPYTYKGNDKLVLLSEIENKIKAIDEKAEPVITVDYSYIEEK